jgi:hypothetical protein
MEENALKHLSDITGDYSFRTSAKNLATFIEGLVDGEKFESVMSNIKDEKKNVSIYEKLITALIGQINRKQSVGSVITRLLYVSNSVLAYRTWNEAFVGIGNTNLDQISYQTLERQMNEFLVVLGKTKINNPGVDTIDQLVQASMPKMQQGVNKFYQEYLGHNSQYVQTLNKAKQQVIKVFDDMEKRLGKALNQENSFLKMLLDLMVPSLDGLQPTVARILNKNYNPEVERANLMKMKEMCTKQKTHNRFSCNLIIFYEEMRAATKDTTFIDRLLDSVEKLALEVLDTEIEASTQEKTMVNMSLFFNGNLYH